MAYNQDDIKQLIRQGENHAVEFKSSQVHADSLAKEMTAFANSYGGVVLIGVDDEGSIEGLSEDRHWEEWVANISRNNIIPPIMPAYQEVEIGDRKVGVITVEKGIERPYQTSRSLFLVRVGSTSRTATHSKTTPS